MSDDRKYRQRGYQDSGREERSGPRPQGPAPKREGPRGRGLGAPTESVFRCSACGEKQTFLDEVPFDAACRKCGADLHTCSSCIHFDTAFRWECRKNAEIPERVVKKRAANACPLFTPKLTQEFAKDADKPSDPRAAFDALFKL